MRRLVPAVLLLALAAVPAPAGAAFFQSEVIEGPTPDLVSLGELDVARDGLGGVVYLKRDQGVDHVFLSQLRDGAFLPAQRMDNGLAPASSQPVVAAGFEGRMAVAYVNEGRLWTQLKAKSQEGFSPPRIIAEGGVSNPSIDISVNGVVYISWTQAGDVRVARANRDDPAFTTIGSPLDIDPPRAAGDTDRTRSRVAVSADGSAVVAWGEQGADGRRHVYARRLFELRLSESPQDLTLDALDGVPATDADTPELDIEDDSSFARVTFRQQTAAGPRLVMRRLVGSLFDPPEIVDGGAAGDRARIDMTGRGESLIGASRIDNAAFAGTIFENTLNSFTRLDGGNGIAPQTTPALGENEDGGVAWLQGTSPADATVRMRYFESGTEGLKVLAPLPDATLANPAFGPVDTTAGIDAGSPRGGDFVSAFIQNGADGRRLVAAFYDKVPSRAIPITTTKARRLEKLRWSASINYLGPVTYRVLVDGEPIGDSLIPELEIEDGMIADGTHRWQVLVLDRRLQTAPSVTRTLRVDNTAPTASVSFRKRGRTVAMTVRARDRGRLPTGVNRILVDVGSGRFVPTAGRLTHTYQRRGRYTVRVRVIDVAGNVETYERSVRV